MTVGWEVLKEDVPILTHPLVYIYVAYSFAANPDFVRAGTFGCDA